MAALIAFAGLTLAYFLMQSESYEAPSTVPPVPVTHNMVQNLISVTQPALAKKIGKCVYPLETSYVRQEGDVFKCRFIFMVLEPYPYGIGVSADIRGSTVVSLEIQNETTIDRIDPFDTFETGEQLKKASMPTIGQLRSVLS
jgi:hypothetical protein